MSYGQLGVLNLRHIVDPQPQRRRVLDVTGLADEAIDVRVRPASRRCFGLKYFMSRSQTEMAPFLFALVVDHVDQETVDGDGSVPNFICFG